MTTLEARWEQLQRNELAGLRRYAMALLAVVVLHIVVCLVAAQFGAFSLQAPYSTWFFSALMVIALVYALVLGSGLTLRLKLVEPTMTIAAALVFWPFMLVSAYFTQLERVLVLVPFLGVLMLASMRLTAQRLLLVSFFACLSYLGLLLWLLHQSPRSFQISIEATQWLVFSAVCFSLPVAARFMNPLRQTHARASRSLVRQLAGHFDSLNLSDSMTGLFNRQYLLDVLHQQKSLADHFGIPFSMFYVDLDHLKSINNLHGQRCGDQVLVAFARFAEHYLRHGDELGRLGEDTFLVVFPQTDGKAALAVAQQIRAAWASQTFMDQSVTLSGAVVAYQAGDTAEGLLHRGRRCLEQAKQQGRNRVLLEQQGRY